MKEKILKILDKYDIVPCQVPEIAEEIVKLIREEDLEQLKKAKIGEIEYDEY